VATSASLLKEGRADLWDSGRVESDQNLHIAYSGRYRFQSAGLAEMPKP
jgi:alpha-L-rhamnosidase